MPMKWLYTVYCVYIALPLVLGGEHLPKACRATVAKTDGIWRWHTWRVNEAPAARVTDPQSHGRIRWHPIRAGGRHT